MITGFNTDIEHNGVVYHVQTEDKGLESPIILSLVYSGGAILASKRSPYEDLIREGFSDEALAERLKRQHRLICAAIHTGRINDLRKMSTRESDVSSEPEISEPQLQVEPTLETAEESTVLTEPPPEFEFEIGEALSQKYEPQPLEETEPEGEEPEEEVVEIEEPEPEPEQPSVLQRPAAGSYRISKQQPPIDPEPAIPEQKPPPPSSLPLQEGLVVRLLDELEFHSGESPTIRVLVTNREGLQENPIQNAAVSVKVLGTTFRPLIYSLKTQRDGVATVATQIPQFTSGRAAVLIRAIAKDQSAEVRCIIHPKR